MLVPLLSCLFLAATRVSSSSISVSYPLEEQLPPVARINSFYTWTFAPNTFKSLSNTTLTYTSSSLPAWLNFDPSDRAFHGTPSASDEGSPAIEVTAHDPSSSETASSWFDLLVSSSSAPVVQHSLDEQFRLPNPSLSSVFLIGENSALRSTHPALRIPPAWSFSIGFQYDTFKSDGDIYYSALQADGTPLPEWMFFSPKSITFNGFTPKGTNTTKPYTLSLALHGSDQRGYSASSLLFDVVVAEHELSLATTSLPTINITAETPFSVSLTSPVDFYGVLLDGKQIQPAEITTLEVDTSYYGQWLKYDTASRTLSGQPPDSLKDADQSTLLPVTLATSVNQTIETNVSIAVVPSYFSTASLQPMLVNPGQPVDFDLQPFYSNQTGINGQDDVNLTAAYDPTDAADFLSFDPGFGFLTGTVPTNTSVNGVNYTHISVTFTAYSHITHSTSHTTLPVSLSPTDFAHQHGPSHGLSAAAKSKLILGLKIAFSVVGGLIFLGLFLAGFRKFARVQDSAVQGEEGMRAWTDEERKYYGVGIEVDGKTRLAPGSDEKGYRWSDSAVRGINPPFDEKYGALGLTRTITSPHPKVQSPGVMRKGEFMGKIKVTARKVSDTVRIVSDTYRRAVHTKARKPLISKPVLVMTSDGDGSIPRRVDPLRFGRSASPRHPDALPFEDLDFSQYAPSGRGTSIIGSPSSSTGGRSIPRRRADFGRPKTPLVLTTPPQAHLHDHDIRRRSSLDSLTSLDTDSSTDTHAAEAVVQHAQRAMSIRSGRSAGGASVGSGNGAKERMTIVNFTSANRVPVPKMPSSYFEGDDPHPTATGNEKGKTKRVVSQVAKVFRSGSTSLRAGDKFEEDALSLGISYVQAYGDDSRIPGTFCRSLSLSGC